MTNHQIIYLWLGHAFGSTLTIPVTPRNNALSIHWHSAAAIAIAYNGITLAVNYSGKHVTTVTNAVNKEELYWVGEIEKAVTVLKALSDKGYAEQPTSRKPH